MFVFCNDVPDLYILFLYAIHRVLYYDRIEMTFFFNRLVFIKWDWGCCGWLFQKPTLSQIYFIFGSPKYIYKAIKCEVTNWYVVSLHLFITASSYIHHHRNESVISLEPINHQLLKLAGVMQRSFKNRNPFLYTMYCDQWLGRYSIKTFSFGVICISWELTFIKSTHFVSSFFESFKKWKLYW